MKGEPFNILMIEDNPADARMIKELLSESGPVSFRMDIADRLSQGIDRAEKDHYDVILLDLGLPDSKGLNTFIKLHTAFNHLPIVVLSGLDEESVALAAVREGAQDYLIKGTVDGHILWRSIRYAIERKQVGQALRESEHKYRALVETLQEGIWTIDKEGCTTYVNPRMAQMLGYTTEDMMGKHLFSFMAESQVNLARTYMERQAQGVKDRFEFELLKKDGSTIYTLLEAGPLNDEKGNHTGALAGITDITERKQSEAALRESEEQFRLSLENAPDGVYMNDLEGNFLYGNFKCQEILGYKREELIGKNFLELNILAEDSLARAAEILQDNINGKSTGPDDLKLIRKDGRLVPVEINTSIIQCKGQATVLAFARDISDRKNAEEKLLKSFESLKKTLDDAINTMVKIVELRDPYTAGHQQKVADLATAIAREMKLEDTRIDQLMTAALIHDIGKIYIPSDILSKPGKLADIEFGLIKTHAQSGYDIVKGMDFPGIVAVAVWQHHERLDGSGYPNRLKGVDTLLEAKILAVADVIEAMASHRPYRAALGIDRALEEISKNKGKLYDPDVVNTCLELFNSGKFVFKSV